jgi:hypothetical protein
MTIRTMMYPLPDDIDPANARAYVKERVTQAMTSAGIKTWTLSKVETAGSPIPDSNKPWYRATINM